MDTPRSKRPLSPLVVKLTNACTARCRHCSARCGLEYDDSLPVALTANAIRSCRTVGIDTLWVSGGEPFLRFRSLCDLVARARDAGLRIVVVSNGYWATTPPRARQALTRLLAAGRFDLALSSDDFHLEFISFARIQHAVAAARDLDIDCWLGRVTYAGDKSRQMMLRWAAGMALPVGEQPIQHAGRGEDIPEAAPGSDLRYISCANCLVPTIVPTGHVAFCCAGPAATNPRLVVGHLRDMPFLDLLDRAKANPLYRVLSVGGPFLLADVALDQDERKNLDGSCRSRCHLCSLVGKLPSLDAWLNDSRLSSQLTKLTCIAALQQPRREFELPAAGERAQ